MKLSSVILAFSGIALAVPISDVFEKLSAIPIGWKQGIHAPKATVLEFHVAVEQPRAAEFEQHVIDISTPGHPLYGRHLSKGEVEEFVAPSPTSTNLITSWLKTNGISTTDIKDDGNWIRFKTTVGKAESLLDTQFYCFIHEDVSMIRTLKYSIPPELRSHVKTIQPTIRFSQIQPQAKLVKGSQKVPVPSQPRGFNATFCNETITPDCVRGLYGLGDFAIAKGNKATFGISGFLDQQFQMYDLGLFMTVFAPQGVNSWIWQGNPPIGPETTNVSDPVQSIEANLDIEYAFAIAPNTNITFFSTPGRAQLVNDLDQPAFFTSENEPYLDQLRFILGMPDWQLPTVLSTSYGENEQSVAAAYANVTCNMFAQLGARGVSVIFSSGDEGVGSACLTNDGTNATRFNPIFPASCPFVTSVGGTQGVWPERAAWFSSGGFSDIFARPAYQEQAVNNYLAKLGSQWQGLYNPNGRGFPDVAAQSVNFNFVDKGDYQQGSGTSVAAPIFAAVISNLNSLRIGFGQRPLGFLNPFLYSIGYQGLTDIIDGGSRGCTGVAMYSHLRAPVVPYASWNATEGWDPVTGLGTPVFPRLVELTVGTQAEAM